MSRRSGAPAASKAAAPLQSTLTLPLCAPLLPTRPAAEDKQKRLLSQDAGHFSLVRALHAADFITELNGFCGVMSVFSSLRYCIQDDVHNYTNLYWALGFIPLGLFFDFMDGKVARWRKKASLMGQELDSLADLVCFFFFFFFFFFLFFFFSTHPSDFRTNEQNATDQKLTLCLTRSPSASPPQRPPSAWACARPSTTSSSPSSCSAA